jgi:hypothetical protein
MSRADVIGTRLLRPLPAHAFHALMYRRLHGRRGDFHAPRTFTEHVVAKILHDHDPRYTLTADKYGVREWVAARLGEEYLIPLLAVADTVDELDLAALPDSFVIKASHGNAATILVDDKSRLDWDRAATEMRGWLDTNWFQFNKEWVYKDIPPRLVVEEYLQVDGRPPADYKFFVFGGRPHMVQVDTARFDSHRRDFFDIDWRPLDVTLSYHRAEETPVKPPEFDEMLKAAAMLGGDFTFARIDLYAHKGSVYFGEITHYPDGGTGRWRPESFDEALGSAWTEGATSPKSDRAGVATA